MNQPIPSAGADLTDTDYRALAAFRHALRGFLQFSEHAAQESGLTPQQHQAMLAIRAAPGQRLTVGELAERLILRPHSATGLVDRMIEAGLLLRAPGMKDRRKVDLALTSKAEVMLATLSAAHRAELSRIRPLLSGLLATIDG